MHIAILTFEGFNELDSLIAYGMLSRIRLLGDSDWRVSIASPSERVTSMNGLTIDAHIDLLTANQADAVLIGSGMKTREVAQTEAIMSQIQLNSEQQLIAAQCSGTFLLSKLGLLNNIPACTDLTSKPWVLESGVDVRNQAFFAQGNIATAGGFCLRNICPHGSSTASKAWTRQKKCCITLHLWEKKMSMSAVLCATSRTRLTTNSSHYRHPHSRSER